MNEPANSQVCERADDLISFLYGELNEREARSFEQHKRTCERCESELAGFGQVRNSVQLWRDESLSFVPHAQVAPKRSAWAAIKSFFEISPLWMKGATAFAAVLLCILSAVAGARLLDEPQPPVLSVSSKTEDEIRIEIESKANLLAQSRINSTIQTAQRSQPKRPANVNAAETQTPATNVARKANKPLSRSERNQLAADLRLTSDDEDDSLQLLGDRINR